MTAFKVRKQTKARLYVYTFMFISLFQISKLKYADFICMILTVISQHQLHVTYLEVVCY